MKYNPFVLVIYAVGFLVAWMKTPRVSEHDRFADRCPSYGRPSSVRRLVRHGF